MSLFCYSEKYCCTCRHWKGVRVNVRAVSGHVFCFKHLVGICRGGGEPREAFPQERCLSWEAMVDASAIDPAK